MLFIIDFKYYQSTSPYSNFNAFSLSQTTLDLSLIMSISYLRLITKRCTFILAYPIFSNDLKGIYIKKAVIPFQKTSLWEPVAIANEILFIQIIDFIEDNNCIAVTNLIFFISYINIVLGYV